MEIRHVNYIICGREQGRGHVETSVGTSRGSLGEEGPEQLLHGHYLRPLPEDHSSGAMADHERPDLPRAKGKTPTSWAGELSPLFAAAAER